MSLSLSTTENFKPYSFTADVRSVLASSKRRSLHCAHARLYSAARLSSSEGTPKSFSADVKLATASSYWRASKHAKPLFTASAEEALGPLGVADADARSEAARDAPAASRVGPTGASTGTRAGARRGAKAAARAATGRRALDAPTREARADAPRRRDAPGAPRGRGVAVGARIDVATTIGEAIGEDRLDDTRSADWCVPRKTATFRVRVTTLARVCVHLARAWSAVAGQRTPRQVSDRRGAPYPRRAGFLRIFV